MAQESASFLAKLGADLEDALRTDHREGLAERGVDASKGTGEEGKRGVGGKLPIMRAPYIRGSRGGRAGRTPIFTPRKVPPLF